MCLPTIMFHNGIKVKGIGAIMTVSQNKKKFGNLHKAVHFSHWTIFGSSEMSPS